MRNFPKIQAQSICKSLTITFNPWMMVRLPKGFSFLDHKWRQEQGRQLCMPRDTEGYNAHSTMHTNGWNSLHQPPTTKYCCRECTNYTKLIIIVQLHYGLVSASSKGSQNTVSRLWIFCEHHYNISNPKRFIRASRINHNNIMGSSSRKYKLFFLP